MSLINPYSMPGMGSPNESVERAILWNKLELVVQESGVIVSTTVDAGSSTTTQLRPGLLLGQITASKKLGVYSATATDGRNKVYGVLGQPVNMLDPNTGTAADRWVTVVIGGPVRAGKVIGLDYAARRQMRARFIFDDDFMGLGDVTATVAKTADYTVLAADCCTVFTTQGAGGNVNFTLPALADITAGWEATFIAEAAGTLTVTAPADKLVAYNDATATSIAFSTSSEIIGNAVRIIVNADATKYIALLHLGHDAASPTIA